MSFKDYLKEVFYNVKWKDIIDYNSAVKYLSNYGIPSNEIPSQKEAEESVKKLHGSWKSWVEFHINSKYEPEV